MGINTNKHSGCKNKKEILIFTLVVGLVTFLIPNLAQAADDAAANQADLSVDNLVLPSAQEAQQDAVLDQAFAKLPASPETATGTTPAVNAEAVVASRLAAIQDSAQEGATLAYGAPVVGAGGLLGTPEEHGHAGRTHEEAGCLQMLHDSVGVGFGSLTQGLPEGSLSPERVAHFEAMHDRFEQMAASFQGMMGGLAGPGGPLPGAGAPIGGPEGVAMPGVVFFQGMNAMLGAAAAGVDPAQFTGMIQAQAQAFQNYFGHAGPGEGVGAQGLPGGPENFAHAMAQFAGGEVNAPGRFTLTSTGVPNPAGIDPALLNSVSQSISQQIADQISHQIAENIAQKIEAQILSTLPPEALRTKEALDANFTATDLTTAQGGTPITRAFSADITDRYKNDQGVSVDMPGQEHIHVTYTWVAGGDGLYPLPHVDANVTAIHNVDHTQTADLTGSGADHIPNIQA